MRISYNLLWQDAHAHSLAHVISTRWGAAPRAQDLPNVCTFVVDFAKGSIGAAKAGEWVPQCGVNVRGGAAKLVGSKVQSNPETNGWRVSLNVEIPPGTDLVELTCDLLDDGRPVSERWDYQWRR